MQMSPRRMKKNEHLVDCVISPLNGSMVSGLHVPDNLQIIKAHDNIMKSNRLETI